MVPPFVSYEIAVRSMIMLERDVARLRQIDGGARGAAVSACEAGFRIEPGSGAGTPAAPAIKRLPAAIVRVSHESAPRKSKTRLLG
jgi:hypothetical protein